MGQKDSDEMRFSRIQRMDVISHGSIENVYRVMYRNEEYAMKVPMAAYRPSDDDRMHYQLHAFGVVNRAKYQIMAHSDVPDGTVRIIDFGTRPYGWTVSEMADFSFDDALDRGRATVSDIISILEKLDALHGYGYCHGNITPTNILNVNGTWKFTDFIISPVKNEVTMEDDPYFWMFKAPEDLLEGGETGYATDVWQMGILLYIVVTGLAPYPDADNMYEIAETIVTEGPDLDPVPGPFRSVLSKALSLESSERYQTAGEMADALRRIGSPDADDLRAGRISPSSPAKKSCPEGSITPCADDSEPPGGRTGGITPSGPAAAEGKRNGRPKKKEGPRTADPDDIDRMSKQEKEKKGRELYEAAEARYVQANSDNPEAYRKSLKLYLGSAELGNNDARFSLGYMYMNGQGTEVSFMEARRYLSLAASGGHKGAEDLLKQMDGRAIPIISQRIVSGYTTYDDRGYLDVSGSEGNPEADRMLGIVYENAIGTGTDMKKAMDHYSRAGEHGDVESLMALANIHLTGKGTMLSYILAGECYEKAAELGSSDAMRALGDMYAEKKLSCDDPAARSREWYAKAKEADGEGSGRRIGRRSEGKKTGTGEKRSLFGLFRRKSR